MAAALSVGFGHGDVHAEPPLEVGEPELVDLSELWPQPAPEHVDESIAASSTDALGQSRGRANSGTLVDAVQLPDGDGYFRRRPARSWATSSTVTHLAAILAEVHEQFPHLHRLAVGDLSLPEGGPLPGHHSHQSGRDVDLGFYYRARPFFYPLTFAPADRSNLHFRATWALLEALASTADAPDGVDYVLLDYRVQAMLHRWAESEGVDTADLERLLQYPRGKDAEVGLVRHFPGHVDHLHVRFKCPPKDMLCVASEPLRASRERVQGAKQRRQRGFEVAVGDKGL